MGTAKWADPLAVAAGCNPGLASWGPLRARRDALAESGSGLGRVLILGATGMAGRLAVANAAALGADTVVAVGRNTDALAELAARGDSVRTVALSGTADDAAAIASSLADGPPTTVLDFVWGPVAERTFTALAPIVGDAEVVHIQIGEGAGTTAAVPGALLRGCRYLLRGSGIGSVDPASLFASVAEFIEMIASGAVAIDYRSYPLSQVGTAWAATGPHRAVVVPG
ncbi:hypothetical protein [Gordonia crocea]|uniref:Oxidoreductase n=1 Tax=Gordonia crocea TaxID=589162 RepID=A0A7I9UXT5_9ACTN|nr:hypothetical protein [Gordonia crocea]GED97630.1 hypothetical protein nbrc107697_16690 [Gordonia crocea]